jgi:hypothetical protein
VDRARHPLPARFWFYVTPTDGCWEWAGPKGRWGYGVINHAYGRDKHARAHRVCWELYFGPIPEGMCICHACDNKICVNPEHLFLGTSRDNTHDMLRKGRRRPGRPPRMVGEGNGAAKLSEAQVREIRELYRPRTRGLGCHSLAKRYGVSGQTIHRVIRGKYWNHVV